jgi:hypothetical protein
VKYTLDPTKEQSKGGTKQLRMQPKKNLIASQHSSSMPATVSGSSPAPDVSVTVPKKRIRKVTVDMSQDKDERKNKAPANSDTDEGEVILVN